MTAVTGTLSGVPARVTARRRVILLAQTAGSLGTTAAAASGALLADHLGDGDARWSAAPLGAVVLGAAASAWPMARLREGDQRVRRLGRGYVAAALGAAVVVLGVAVGSMSLLLGGNVLLGVGNSTVMLSRYLVADLSEPGQRSRAIGTSFGAVAVGAIAGPALLGPSSSVVAWSGLAGPAGMYVVASFAFVLAAVGLAATAGAGSVPSAAEAASALTTATITVRRAWPLGALVSLGAANLTMVALMAVLPLHMNGHGADLDQVGLMISAHVAAMFAGAPLLGRLIARAGTVAVAVPGAGLLVGTGVLTTLAAPLTWVSGTVAMVALGLGWSGVVVSQSALLASRVREQERGPVEAAGEIVMGVAAATGCFVLAGPLVALGGASLLAVATVPLNLAALLLVLRDRAR